MKNILTIFFLSIFGAMKAETGSFDESLFKSLHGHGSFNVVLVVIGIILLGLFITLWRIDKKVAKLEKEIQNKK